LDFSKNIDIIKDSLRQYDYSIDIITIWTKHQTIMQ
jgi:hypothetical protein